MGGAVFPPCYLPEAKLWAFLVAQRLKRLPPMRETWVRSLGREDPLEKEMVIHFSILAWRIPWTEKPSRLHPTGSQRVGHDWATSPYFTLPYLTLMRPKSFFSLLNRLMKQYIGIQKVSETDSNILHFLNLNQKHSISMQLHLYLKVAQMYIFLL